MNDIDKQRQSFIGKINDNHSAVLDINQRILTLLHKRWDILSDSYDISKKICGLKNIIGIEEYSLIKEFNDNGFDSKMVQDAVLKIRNLFFNDSIKEYQSYDCTDISYYDSEGAGKISFEFSNQKKTFLLCIIKQPHTFNLDLLCDEYIDGGMYISFKRNDYYIDNFGSKFSINEIRNDIYNFIFSKPLLSKSEIYEKDHELTLDMILGKNYIKNYIK